MTQMKVVVLKAEADEKAAATEELASKVAGDTQKAVDAVVVLVKSIVAAVVTMAVVVRAVGVQRLGEERRVDEPRIEVAVGAQLPVVVDGKTKRL